jgi:hypothetical protein
MLYNILFYNNIIIYKHWLSIIKQLTKTKYNIKSNDFQFTENGKYIRTHIYSFTLIDI